MHSSVRVKFHSKASSELSGEIFHKLYSEKSLESLSEISLEWSDNVINM